MHVITWANTLHAEVKNPPQNVTVVVLGAYSIRVTWSPPEHDGNDAPITGYRVVYGQIDTGTSHSTATAALSAVLERLAPFTNYFVRVAAMREEEIGVYSNDVFVQTRSAGMYTYVSLTRPCEYMCMRSQEHGQTQMSRSLVVI